MKKNIYHQTARWGGNPSEPAGLVLLVPIPTPFPPGPASGPSDREGGESSHQLQSSQELPFPLPLEHQTGQGISLLLDVTD